MKNKRGQAAGAAVLLAIVMGMIILFIILIPPGEREKILSEEDTEEESTLTEVKETLLRESPGWISYIKENEIEKVIPSSHIFTKTEPSVLIEREYLAVEKTLFSSQEKEIYFEIEDLARTENVLLDFIVEDYEGDLIILLNGKEIFNKETHKIKPLKLSESLLASENTLIFKVSSPGIAFWRTNQYDLKNVRIIADLTDTSAQKSKHFFYMGLDESQNIEKASLRFSISCVPEETGKLEVMLNDHAIFSGMPENCEDILYYDLPSEIIEKGNNWLSFKTDRGDYEIYHAAVKIELKEPAYPVYYFELDEKYFEEEILKDNYDVVLTLEFTSGESKEAELFVNGHKTSFDTHKIEFSHNIDSRVEPWTNSIKIVPKTSFDIRELKVELKTD